MSVSHQSQWLSLLTAVHTQTQDDPVADVWQHLHPAEDEEAQSDPPLSCFRRVKRGWVGAEGVKKSWKSVGRDSTFTAAGQRLQENNTSQEGTTGSVSIPLFLPVAGQIISQVTSPRKKHFWPGLKTTCWFLCYHIQWFLTRGPLESAWDTSRKTYSIGFKNHVVHRNVIEKSTYTECNVFHKAILVDAFVRTDSITFHFYVRSIQLLSHPFALAPWSSTSSLFPGYRWQILSKWAPASRPCLLSSCSLYEHLPLKTLLFLLCLLGFSVKLDKIQAIKRHPLICICNTAKNGAHWWVRPIMTEAGPKSKTRASFSTNKRKLICKPARLKKRLKIPTCPLKKSSNFALKQLY